MTLTASPASSRTTTPGTSRPDLPSPAAARLRCPSWRDPRLLVGVVLVASSVVAGAKVVSAYDDTAPYYRTTRALTAGQTVTASDVAVVDVRLGEAEGGYLAGTEDPVGAVVTRTMASGEFVPVDAIGHSDMVAVAPIGVPVSAAVAQQLSKGDVVDVWIALADPDRPGTYVRPERSVAGATVSTVATGGSTFSVGSESTVGVLVPSQAVMQVLDALANGAKLTLVPAPGSAR